jgi:hypothetical protein
VGETGGASVPRAITQSPHGRTLPFHFRVNPDEEGMAVDIAVPYREGENITATMVTHDDATTDYHIHMIAADAGPWPAPSEHNIFRPGTDAPGEGDTWVERCGSERLFRLRLPWHVFTDRYRAAPKRPLMLRVAAWETAIECADPVVCVPLSFVTDQP